MSKIKKMKKMEVENEEIHYKTICDNLCDKFTEPLRIVTIVSPVDWNILSQPSQGRPSQVGAQQDVKWTFKLYFIYETKNISSAMRWKI